MAKIKLIADSTCDLGDEVKKLLDIEIAPLMINFENEDKTYYDLENIDLDTIVSKVDEFGVLPKTSSRSPEYHRELFQKYIDLGYEVVFVSISSALSNTFNSALLGKSDTTEPAKVQIIDSRNLSSSQGLLLLKIKELADKGLSAREIRTICENEIIPNLRCSFAMQTVKYMVKGGRCSAMKGFFSRMLQIKPIISVVDGQLQLTKNPIGSMKKAINMILDDMVEELDSVDNYAVYVTSFKNDSCANFIIDKIKSLNYFKHIYTAYCGTIIGAHCGPGCIGILYLKKDK